MGYFGFREEKIINVKDVAAKRLRQLEPWALFSDKEQALLERALELDSVQMNSEVIHHKDGREEIIYRMEIRKVWGE